MRIIKNRYQIIEITEEEDGSVVRSHKIFCASKYLDKLSNLNKIVDLTDIDETSEKMILEHINENCLCDLIDSDYYFLENNRQNTGWLSNKYGLS